MVISLLCIRWVSHLYNSRRVDWEAAAQFAHTKTDFGLDGRIAMLALLAQAFKNV